MAIIIIIIEIHFLLRAAVRLKSVCMVFNKLLSTLLKSTLTHTRVGGQVADPPPQMQTPTHHPLLHTLYTT